MSQVHFPVPADIFLRQGESLAKVFCLHRDLFRFAARTEEIGMSETVRGVISNDRMPFRFQEAFVLGDKSFNSSSIHLKRNTDTIIRIKISDERFLSQQTTFSALSELYATRRGLSRNTMLGPGLEK
jgi:hypothetical protein